MRDDGEAFRRRAGAADAGWRRNTRKTQPPKAAEWRPRPEVKTFQVLDHSLQISPCRQAGAFDARFVLRIGGTKVTLETEACLIERLTGPAAPWSAFLEASPEEAAWLFERVCASDVSALERKLEVTVIVEELRIGAPQTEPAGGALWFRLDWDNSTHPARLTVESGSWSDRIRAYLGMAASDSFEARAPPEAVVALELIAGAAETLGKAEVGDIVIIAAAGETLSALVSTPTLRAPARLGSDVLVLTQDFSPQPEGPDLNGYIEIGALTCDISLAPGVELAFRTYDDDRARWVVAGRLRAVGHLVNADGGLAFAIEELPDG